MNWKPWEEYKKELELLPIKEPPCSSCKNFKPVRKYIQWSDGSTHFDGVIICQAKEMQKDFSCYEEDK